MSSPFPGVDLYIEDQAWWPDFHQEFISAWRADLLGNLPEGYDARLGEHVYLVVPDEEFSKVILPDVAVSRTETGPEGFDNAVETESAGVATATLTLPAPFEVKESFVQILHQPDRRLVAVLELLSPTNKGTHYGKYLEKRDDVIQTPAHLVELDLLISGRKPPMREPLPAGQLHVFISRGDERPKSKVSGWSIRQPLPRISIPLLRPNERVVSDLQTVYDATYTRAHYERAIDYARPLELRLSDADRTWIAERLSTTP
jgi:Protein of unknown function (DUF4058)